MTRIEFHPEASREVDEAHAWYRQRSDVAAQAFALDLDHALDAIGRSPERWPITRHGERRFVLSKFPYSIVYRIRADDVFVTALAHQRRRPGYWRSRTSPA